MRLLVLAALAACSRANIGAPKPSTAVPVGPNAGGPGAAWDWRRQLNDVLPHVQLKTLDLTDHCLTAPAAQRLATTVYSCAQPPQPTHV